MCVCVQKEEKKNKDRQLDQIVCVVVHTTNKATKCDEKKCIHIRGFGCFLCIIIERKKQREREREKHALEYYLCCF